MGACAVRQVAHAAEQVAVGHPGGRDDHLAGRELVGLEDLVDVVDSVLTRLLDLVARGRPELRLELPTQATKSGRGENRLPGAADADRQVVVGAAYGSGDRRGHVAVLDELDARAGGADLLDQVVVARAVKHDRRDVPRTAAVGIRDRHDVLRDRLSQVDAAARDRPHRHLAHVHLRQARKGSGLSGGDHGHRAVVAPRDHRTAFERVYRQIDLEAAASHSRADGERLDLLVPTDDDAAGDLERVQAVPHRRRRRLLGSLHVAAAEPTRSGKSGPLRDGRIGLAPAGKVLFGAQAGWAWAWARSTSASTRWMIPLTADSIRVFSSTGTPAFPARTTR